jgi:TonB family protein
MHCYERIFTFDATLRRLISILAVVVTSLSLAAPNAAAQLRTSGIRKIVVQVSPEYPAIARKMHLAGTVRLLATVNAAGKVTKTEVLGGSPVLAQAAADAVIKSKWESGSGETREVVEVKFQPDTD